MKITPCLFLALFLCSLASCKPGQDAKNTWSMYRGGPESNCYSALEQINTANVQGLKPAWTYHTGDKGTTIQCNPIIVDGWMYITSPALKLIALNAADGGKRWEFIPSHGAKGNEVNRGVTYWADGADKRILFTAGSFLYAVNAESGRPIDDFGIDGSIDLRAGLDRDSAKLAYDVSSPGIIFKNLLILGSHVSEGEGAAPGHVRAFDVKSGRVAWIFHTIPQPGEYGYSSWEKNAWKTIGGANTWSGFSLDIKRGWVFFATGSASPDFYGGDRKGQNLFANSVVALDAANGKRIWHYQVVHHDLWDYDLPTVPNLVTVKKDGKDVEAVAQATKTGNIFLLNRETGEPLYPVEERKVAVSDIEGEQSWPTQPFPTKPAAFVRQRYTEDDLTNISPEANAYARDRYRQSRNEGIFTPSSEQGSMVFPGMRGGAEWNGASVDIRTGMLYINANEIPNIMSLKKIYPAGSAEALGYGKNIYQLHCATCHGLDRKGRQPFPSLVNISGKMNEPAVIAQVTNGKGQMPAFPNLTKEDKAQLVAYLFNKPVTAVPQPAAGSADSMSSKPRYAHSGYAQFLDSAGYPAVKPPWGTLNAIDLNTGDLRWKIPLGEYAELTRRGIPVTGTQNFGGTLVTAGGLIFVGATKDEKFRAIEAATGKILWERLLPAGGYATPSTYEVNGKQYVVIAAGGGGKNNTKTGNAYIAFAL